jgi:hypothetical protein
MRAPSCAVVILLLSGCGGSAPGKTYYQRNIEPILLQKCSGNTSGCHAANADDPYQFAAGNFDVTSFANVQKRRDLLQTFGAYPYPLLLIKGAAASTPDSLTPCTSDASCNGAEKCDLLDTPHVCRNPNKLTVQYGKACSDNSAKSCHVDADCGGTATCNDQFLPLDVLHAGQAILQPGSDAFFTLQTWLANGATENGVKPATPAQTGNGMCSTSVPAGFDPTPYQMNASFAQFKNSVQPILQRHGCYSGNCHGAPQSDFYITCGNDDTQSAFNFSQAWSFVSEPVDDSQILRVPLAVSAGGHGHTGGDQWASTSDADYLTVRTWADAVKRLDFAMGDPVKQFFADNVQPILLRRGCSFQACHSPAATNDFKLRSGTQGFFSAISLEKNYELLKYEFMATEFPDARRSRAVAKGILTDDYRVSGVGGITHRAGSILETAGAPSDPSACTLTATPSAWTGASPFCTIQEWLFLERNVLAAKTPSAVTSMNQNDTVNIVYVTRPNGQGADRLQFDTFQGGADLMVASATFGANFGQQLAVNGAPTSLLASCGFTGSVDIGLPDVKYDGDTVAFAARTATTAWNVYTVSIANGGCAPVPGLAQPDQNGMHIHNFDPAWAWDGSYLVFASTRGKSGPTVSRKRMLPQSDLWRIKPDGSGLEQMTVLSNSELRPHFMREGRVTMTTEKASDGFYQLSGRRMNWDRTDYHPLLAQRGKSLYVSPTDLTTMNPSIGYDAATDIREGSDGNFMIILSDVAPDGTPVLKGGAGALGIFNRSIGPFEQGRSDAGYLKSLRVIGDGAATGHAGATAGYRSPFYMPDGQVLVSYTTTPQSPAWRIVAVNPRPDAQGNYTQTDLIAPAGSSAVDAVIAYKNPWPALAPASSPRQLYDNRRQLVFGGSSGDVDPAHAVLHMPDAPMVFTMLTGNLRRGRPVDAFRKANHLVVYTEGLCPATGCTANTNGIYQNRSVLGSAGLAGDGSTLVQLPSLTGVVLELQDGSGNKIVTMGEEHQLGPGEKISMGISQKLFDAVCGGCHGSVSGSELDIAVTADALTGASASASAGTSPIVIGP